MRDPIVV